MIISNEPLTRLIQPTTRVAASQAKGNRMARQFLIWRGKGEGFRNFTRLDSTILRNPNIGADQPWPLVAASNASPFERTSAAVNPGRSVVSLAGLKTNNEGAAWLSKNLRRKV